MCTEGDSELLLSYSSALRVCREEIGGYSFESVFEFTVSLKSYYFNKECKSGLYKSHLLQFVGLSSVFIHIGHFFVGH